MRVATNRPYTVIDNELLQDVRISHETKGLICELLSRPHDWEITVRGIMATGRSGRDKVYRMIREAELFGYLKPLNQRGKKGVKYQYKVVEVPLPEKQESVDVVPDIQETQKAACNQELDLVVPEKAETVETEVVPEKLVTGNLVPEKRTQQSKDINKIKNKQNGRKAHAYDDRYVAIWNDYRSICKKRGDSAGAKLEGYQVWKTFDDDQKINAERGLRFYVADCDQTRTKLKHFCRYLSKQAWEGFEEQMLPWFEQDREFDEEFLRQVLIEVQPNGHWPEDRLGPPPGAPGSKFTRFIKQLGIQKYVAETREFEYV